MLQVKFRNLPPSETLVGIAHDVFLELRGCELRRMKGAQTALAGASLATD